MPDLALWEGGGGGVDDFPNFPVDLAQLTDFDEDPFLDELRGFPESEPSI